MDPALLSRLATDIKVVCLSLIQSVEFTLRNSCNKSIKRVPRVQIKCFSHHHNSNHFECLSKFIRQEKLTQQPRQRVVWTRSPWRRDRRNVALSDALWWIQWSDDPVDEMHRMRHSLMSRSNRCRVSSPFCSVERNYCTAVLREYSCLTYIWWRSIDHA